MEGPSTSTPTPSPSVYRLSTLSALRELGTDLPLTFTVVWEGPVNDETALVLIQRFGEWARKRHSVTISIRDSETGKEVECYRYNANFLLLSLRYGGSEEKEAPALIRDLPFSSFCLNIRNYTYPEEEWEEEGEILEDYLGPFLDIDSKEITELVIREPFPYMVDPDHFPYLQTLRGEGEEVDILSVFDSEIPDVTHLFGNACFSVNVEAPLEDIQEDLRKILKRFPDLEEAHLTIRLIPWIPESEHLDPAILNSPILRGILAQYPNLHITFHL